MNLDYLDIRNANVKEAKSLSDLAIRSKSYWGYDIDFLNHCREHIRVDEVYIKNWPVKVLEYNNTILGFYSLKTIANENRLDNLWLDLPYIGQNFGRKLFNHATVEAKALGWNSFRLAGEPGAIKFYEKMGARHIGMIQSRLGKDIRLPHMEYIFSTKNPK